MTPQEMTRGIFDSIIGDKETISLKDLQKGVIEAKDIYGKDAEIVSDLISDLIDNHDICDYQGKIDTFYIDDYLTSYGY